jgi:hypothetical protein
VAAPVAAAAAKAGAAAAKSAAAAGNGGGGGGGGRQEAPRAPGDGGGGGLLIAAIPLAGVVGLLIVVTILFFPIFIIGGIVAADRYKDPLLCDNAECIGTGSLPRGAQPFEPIYDDAARAFGVNRFLLMAVHEDETNYGNSTAKGVTDGLNFAGCCAGPMQFLIASGARNTIGGRGGTWAGYANAYRDPRVRLRRPKDYPGMYAPHPNVYDSYDSIYAAAKYFHGLDVGPELDNRTLEALRHYKGTPPASEPFAQHDYQRAKQLEKAGGRLGAMYAKASEIAKLAPPYTFGGGHDPRFTPPYDCSGLVSTVLAAGGLLNVALDTVSLNYWGEEGEGKSFTVWTRPLPGPEGHTFIEFNVNGRTRFIEANGPRGNPAGWRASKDTSGYLPRHWRGM